MALNENLYVKNILSKKLGIKCNEMGENIDEILKDKLIKSVGNRCLKEGYINGDSINIINRTLGKINPNHFNGEIYYNVQYEADICNPQKNMIIACKVKDTNQLGIMAEVDCLTIVIAKQFLGQSIKLSNYNMGDIINVSIIGSRFDLNDKNITIIAKLA